MKTQDMPNGRTLGHKDVWGESAASDIRRDISAVKAAKRMAENPSATLPAY